jgi:hypothetical protein
MSEPESEAPGALCLMSNREDLQGIDNQPYVPTAALQKLVATKRNSAAFGSIRWRQLERRVFRGPGAPPCRGPRT